MRPALVLSAFAIVGGVLLIAFNYGAHRKPSPTAEDMRRHYGHRTVEEIFAHVDPELRDLAVAGYVRVNPHMNGVDFHTMMEMILDADAYIPAIGDVEIDDEAALELCLKIAEQRLLW